MSPAIPVLLALGLGLIGWLAARSRAWAFRKTVRAGGGELHSLPNYHGWYVALWIVIPAILFAIIWNVVSPGLVLGQVLADPAAANLPGFGVGRDSILSEAKAIAGGQAGAAFNPQSAALVAPFRGAIQHYGVIGVIITVLLGFVGGALAFLRLRPNFTARTRV